MTDNVEDPAGSSKTAQVALDAALAPQQDQDKSPHKSEPTAQNREGEKNEDDNHEGEKNEGKKNDSKGKDSKKPAGGFDATPIPDAPQGFTVRFIFHKAENLPPADFDTGSSDPFLFATIKGSNPKRHEEDPDLTHRTPTVRRSIEPEWEDEWIVANVPPTGFSMKCRLYDEDLAAANDCLGEVTIDVPKVDENWEGIPPPGKLYNAKKRVIAKQAYFIKAISSIFKSNVHMTPRLWVSMEVLEKSDPPFAQMYTVGPTGWVKHVSAMIGRLAGIKVNQDEEEDMKPSSSDGKKSHTKYDFQANEMQLQGPVPPKMYHRYVEFRPIIGSMFASTGLRGKILHAALHKQHDRIYNFGRTTEHGQFEACSEEAAMSFLKLAHFDEGGRIFTYVLTLDGLFRFTETGKEFGIDLLSKHTMHSDVAKYIACSGEFFIRRLERPNASDDLETEQKTHPTEPIDGGPPNDEPPLNVSYYQLVIDNDSGTYRPDKSILDDLKGFFEKNFPGLGIVAMHWEEEELQKAKEAQRNAKKNEGEMTHGVLNKSSASSISSAESELDDHENAWQQGQKSKRETAFEAVEDPSTVKNAAKKIIPHRAK